MLSMLANIFFSYSWKKSSSGKTFFHLEGEHDVYFQDEDDIDDIIFKPSISQSMFTAWMECNKIFQEARNLTYTQFSSKFVYVKKNRC